MAGFHIDPFKPFDPGKNGIYDVHFPKFAFWCQKIQPLVYDDSLSYYEVLCRISAKLNEVIKQINDLTEAQKEFVELVTNLLNQIIAEWNKMIDYWNSIVDQWEIMQKEFNDIKTQFNNMVDIFNQMTNEFNIWRDTFNQKITQINNALTELDEFKTEITNEWNRFSTEITNAVNQMRTEINNLTNRVDNIKVNVDHLPIIKTFLVRMDVQNNLAGEGEFHGGTIACADLIYPECTIRFISAIISAYASFTTSYSTGAIDTMRFTKTAAEGTDLSFAWLGSAMTNPAIGAGQLSIDGVGYPCTMEIDDIMTNQNEFIVKIPNTSGVSIGNHTGRYNVYEGGKTMLYRTTPNYFDTLIGG